MKLNKLASAFQRCTWLIDQRAADQFYPTVERFLNGETVTWFENNKAEEEKLLEAYGFSKEGDKWTLQNGEKLGSNQGFYADAPDDSIAIITIEGTIMKDDYCGSIGTDTIGAMLMDALMSPSIIGAILKMNSPGGTVEGTAELEQVVDFVSDLMPVEVFTDGQLCSAAYWIASPCRITASSGTVEIGSIGTAANFKDYSKGSQVVSHYITADKSFDKNKDAREALKGNYLPIKSNIINPTNDIFHTGIKTNRGDKLQLVEKTSDAGDITGEEPLTGQVYLAQAAIDNGLIDAIGNLQTVLDSIRSRADSDEFSTQQNQYNMSLFGKKEPFKKLGAIKTKKAAEITDEEIVAVNEEFEAEGYGNVAVISTAHLDEANTNADTLTSGLTAINAALGLTGEGKGKTSLTEAITALVADRDAQSTARKTAEALAAKYGDQPGAKPTQVATSQESEGGAVVTDKEQSSWEKKGAQKQAQNKQAS